MNVAILIRTLILILICAAGYTLLLLSTSWMTALGVFLLHCALRIDDYFGREEKVVGYFQRRREHEALR